ncbi:MAG: hypothetical protein QM644_05055 [Mobilitalea sp.]
MKERYIPAFIMLIAGAITSIINIVNQVELVTALKRLLLVIIIFYIIGLLIKAILHIGLKKLAKKQVENLEEVPVSDEENIT